MSNKIECYPFLAGEESGVSPIGRKEKNDAFNSQKHPLANKFSGIIVGFCISASATLAGLTAYLFRNPSIENSLTGNGYSAVCIPCIRNLALLKNHMMPSFAPLQERVWGVAASLWDSRQLIQECGEDAPSDKACRFINYAGEIVHAATQSPFLLAGCFGIILGLAAMLSLETSNNKELKVEQDLIDRLKNKFGSLADRLLQRFDSSTTPEEAEKVRELALNILDRRKFLYQSLVDLKLPTISTSLKAEEIAQNLIHTACEIG